MVLSNFGSVSASIYDLNVIQPVHVQKIATNQLPAPQLVFQGTEEYTANGKNFTRYKLAVANWEAFPAAMFKAAPDLPPCGDNKNSSQTWVEINNAQTNNYIYGFCALPSPKNLNSIWFAVEKGQRPPKSVYIILKDRRANKNYRSNEVVLERSSALKEDCIAFNPNNIAVKQVNGSWKIVENENHWMFDFGNKKDEATRAFQVIKKYGMNKSCFVGRPQPSFTYLLVNDNAPSSSMPGEDCVAFNPATTTLSKINNRWKIVDGSHWMFDFGTNKAEAEQSLDIIKKYNFTRSCFVGRPNPSFTYLRK
ncbi:MAG: hypothetical protein IGS39_18535 [Calothrix sp. C42_A2020_038]|nr:hypothetical protein [Calothrix sp. C42_A2020_038]